jgi:hypothetical protein
MCRAHRVDHVPIRCQIAFHTHLNDSSIRVFQYEKPAIRLTTALRQVGHYLAKISDEMETVMMNCRTPGP